MQNGAILGDLGSLLTRVIGKNQFVHPSHRVHVSKVGTRLDGWGWVCALINLPPQLNQVQKIPHISIKWGKTHGYRGKNCHEGALQGARSQPALGSKDQQEPYEDFRPKKTPLFFHFFLILLTLFFSKAVDFQAERSQRSFSLGANK